MLFTVEDEKTYYIINNLINYLLDNGFIVSQLADLNGKGSILNIIW